MSLRNEQIQIPGTLSRTQRSLLLKHVPAGRLSLLLLLILAVLCSQARLAASEPKGFSTNSNPVVLWNELLLQAVQDTRSTPTVTARALAIVHTSMFNAWAAYEEDARATEPDMPHRLRSVDRTLENKAVATNYAAYRSLLDLFPSEAAIFRSAMQQLDLDPADVSLDPSTPVGIGNIAAAAVLEDRHHDGSNQLGDLHPGAYSDYTGYMAINDPDHINNPDHWQPLRIPDGNGGFVVQKYASPQWGLVKPFALSSGSEYRFPQGPASLERDRSRYVAQAKELIRLNANLADRDKMIAEYWALGPGSVTPPGRWFEFAQFISARDHHTLDEDVKLFFILGNAMLDASIACWDDKRAFDSERPITAIRYLYAGQQLRAWGGPFEGTREIDGSEWIPYQEATVMTPAFPEFVSGHSTFSAVDAAILRRWTGSDRFDYSYTAPTGSSLIEPGQTPREDVTLRWGTFLAAANQAGFSRRIGGIHFEDGDLAGRATGQLIANKVWSKTHEYFEKTEGRKKP